MQTNQENRLANQPRELTGFTKTDWLHKKKSLRSSSLVSVKHTHTSVGKRLSTVLLLQTRKTTLRKYFFLATDYTILVSLVTVWKLALPYASDQPDVVVCSSLISIGQKADACAVANEEHTSTNATWGSDSTDRPGSQSSRHSGQRTIVNCPQPSSVLQQRQFH